MMQAANNDNIHILGATILRLSGKNNKGEECSTRQMVYMTDNTDKLFLSREACVDLGIIPNTFPTIGEAEETESGNHKCLPAQHQCQCPKRTKPPPIPTSLQFPATEANREKLQQYLLDYYASSTFKTCEHQALPLKNSPPMRLMIDPDATPTAHHSPIPVPLHWQDAVKDRHYTTFITPWGRYRYCTAPQDYIPSGDGYPRRYDEITSPSPTKPNVWTIPYYDLTQSKRASSKPQTGWIPVADMGSPSTRRSFTLLKTMSNLQTLNHQ